MVKATYQELQYVVFFFKDHTIYHEAASSANPSLHKQQPLRNRQQIANATLQHAHPPPATKEDLGLNEYLHNHSKTPAQRRILLFFLGLYPEPITDFRALWIFR